MKKVLLAVLVALGLQTQAQITCDSITTTYLDITPVYIEVTTNVMSFGIPYTDHTWDLYEGCQLAQLTIVDTNTTAIIPLPNPMINDTFVICNWSDFFQPPYTCYSCDTFAWDYSYGIWERVQQQELPTLTPNWNFCDSISYVATGAGNYPFGVQGFISDSLNDVTDTVEFNWMVCTQDMCYSGYGPAVDFPQVTYQDTLKVCYDAYTIINNTIDTVCTYCDSLVWDGIEWVLFSMSNPTSINELTLEKTNNNKIYDLLGREVTKLQTGIVYIRNGKKYILSE